MPVSPADLRLGRWVIFRSDPSLPLWHAGRIHAVLGDRVTVVEPFTLSPRGRIYRAPYPSVSVLLSEIEAVLERRPTLDDLKALLATPTGLAPEG